MRAAPRVAEVARIGWRDVPSFGAAASPRAVGGEGGCGGGEREQRLQTGAVVRVGGVVSKPELNGKFGTVVRAANEAGRLGVRLEGGKESCLHLRPTAD